MGIKPKNCFIEKGKLILRIFLVLIITPQIFAQVRIMPLGDSITWGTNPDDTTSPGYRRILDSLLTNAGYNFDFVGSRNSGEPNDFDRDNEGWGGYVAGDPAFDQNNRLDLKLNNFLDQNPPNVVLLLMGTNDITEIGFPYEKTAAEVTVAIRKLLDTIYVYDPDITIFLSNIIDRADHLYRHNKTVATNSLLPTTIDSLPSARKEKIVLINMYDALGDYYTDTTNTNFTYGPYPHTNLYTLHPNNNGYRVMANTWFNTIQNFYRPVLASPSNGASGLDTAVALNWNAPPAANGSTVYHLQVSTNAAFTDTIFQDSSITGTSIQPTGLQYGTTYHWRVKILNFGWSAVWSFTTVPALLFADINVFLQGPYSSGTMSTALKTAGYIPLSQPYNTTPWNYTGTEIVGSIPSDVVDWVLVELRETATDTAFARRAAFLKSDGSVVDLNGTSPVDFTGISQNNYYIVIRHRNHLAVMSADTVAPAGSTLTYDFTSGDGTQFYPGSGIGAKELTTGIWGMRSGDGTANGAITASDNNTIWLPQFLAGEDGYKSGDYNLSGSVTASDNNLNWLINNGTDSQVP